MARLHIDKGLRNQATLFSPSSMPVLQPDKSRPLPVEITNFSVGNTRMQLTINGMDITPWVSSMSLDADYGSTTRLRLELSNVEVNRVAS